MMASSNAPAEPDARDDAHRARLVDALEASRDIDVTGVRVHVSEGIVTLTGEVGSAAERLAIRSTVVGDWATAAVVDELWADLLPGEWRLGDDEITSLVAARLDAHPELVGVTPTCDFHSVQLDGEVTDGVDRRLAHHLARTTPGVHFVVDRIETLTPARTDVVPAER
jgi:osmotically-inducible protein OsmY